MASSGDRSVTVGVFQIEYHAAATVSSCDYLEEPLGTTLVSPLRSKFAIDPALKAIRARYLDWCGVRIQALLDALAATGSLPDVLVFPECSVPRECLHLLRDFAVANHVAVFAGTHSPAASAGDDAYKHAGVRANHCRTVLAKRPSQVLPLLQPKQSLLIGKKNRSVHEQTEAASDVAAGTSDVNVVQIQLAEATIDVSVSICADALRQPSAPVRANLEIVVALQTDPAAFASRAEYLRSNGIPVILANHAGHGGSGTYANVDSRNNSWFFAPPFMGRLPPGECYLELRLNLDTPAVQVGIANPQRPVELVRIMPVLHNGSVVMTINDEAEKACSSRNTTALEACIRELEKAGARFAAERWRHLLALVQVDNADEAARTTYGGALVLNSLPLAELQEELCEEIASKIEAVLRQGASQSLPVETIGAGMKVAFALHGKRARKASAQNPALSLAARTVIDRTRETDRIRDFINDRGGVLLVGGFPQIGKSSIIEKALQDTGVKATMLQCREGTSADFLYEVLLRHGNCTPSTARPRSDFDVGEVEAALRPVDVLWIRDAQHLILARTWAAPAIESFLMALVDAATRARVSILVETTTALPGPLNASVGVGRVNVRGLAEKDGAAVFMRELRALGTRADAETEEVAQLSKLVSGHPRLLAMCAEACTGLSIRTLVDQLEKGVGEISASAERLLGQLQLAERDKAALRCLAETRAPIPAPLLGAVARESDSVGVLDGSSLLERDDDDFVRLAPLLRFVARRFPIDAQTRMTFHRSVSAHFAKASRDTTPSKALEWAVEANYHAQQAGISQPCPVDGLLDPIVALARQASDEDNYLGVIAVLEPLTKGRDGVWKVVQSRPDVVKMLVHAFAKTARFKEANECVEALLTQGIGNAVMYLDVAAGALHAGQVDVAKRCADLARKNVPTTPALPLLEGRICQRENNFHGAFERYTLALAMPSRHPWVPFYLARLLLAVDEPLQALAIIDEAFNDVVDGLGRVARRLENALRELQLQALVIAGRLDEAEALARALVGIEELAPEAMLTLAFVGAQSKASGYEVIKQFDALVDKATPRAKTERGFFARVALFRGKLLSHIGDVVGAEEEFARASKGQPYHRHVLRCHDRELAALLQRRPNDQSARNRRSEVAQAMRVLDAAGKEALAPSSRTEV